MTAYLISSTTKPGMRCIECWDPGGINGEFVECQVIGDECEQVTNLFCSSECCWTWIKTREEEPK